MDGLYDSDANARQRSEIAAVVERLHRETLSGGFYGKVVVEWAVENSTIQPLVESRVARKTLHKAR